LLSKAKLLHSTFLVIEKMLIKKLPGIVWTEFVVWATLNLIISTFENISPAMHYMPLKKIIFLLSHFTYCSWKILLFSSNDETEWANTCKSFGTIFSISINNILLWNVFLFYHRHLLTKLHFAGD
jgi:hypothetical protein